METEIIVKSRMKCEALGKTDLNKNQFIQKINAPKIIINKEGSVQISMPEYYDILKIVTIRNNDDFQKIRIEGGG